MTFMSSSPSHFDLLKNTPSGGRTKASYKYINHDKSLSQYATLGSEPLEKQTYQGKKYDVTIHSRAQKSLASFSP